MEQSVIESLAAQLVRADETHTRIEPFTHTHPELTLAEAYRIQLAYVAQRVQRGARIVGKKLGATGKPVQQALGVTHPLSGFLFANDFSEREPIVFAKQFEPRVEPELAFIINRRLAGRVTVDDVLNATEGVRPAFEVPDCALTTWQAPAAAVVAANVNSCGFVLGAKLTPVRDLDLRTIGVVVEKNGEIIGTNATAAVLGSPALAVAWLANALGEQGHAIEPGDIVLTGSLTPMLAVQAGDVFTATFGCGIGSVRVRFV